MRCILSPDGAISELTVEQRLLVVFWLMQLMFFREPCGNQRMRLETERRSSSLDCSSRRRDAPSEQESSAHEDCAQEDREARMDHSTCFPPITFVCRMMREPRLLLLLVQLLRERCRLTCASTSGATRTFLYRILGVKCRNPETEDLQAKGRRGANV